jgi:hypothetical protein
MSPYANRNSIATHRAEIFSRTPILKLSAMWESDVVDTFPSVPSLFRAFNHRGNAGSSRSLGGLGRPRRGAMAPDEPNDRDDETKKERIDRELIELLNDARVALPGVQVLFAFLLVVPFNQRFVELTTAERWVYYAALLSTALAAALLIAPSSYHRLRFRQGDKEQMLLTSNRLLVSGLAFAALSIALAVGLISEFVFGPGPGLVAGLGIGAWLGWFWYGLPLSRRT